MALWAVQTKESECQLFVGDVSERRTRSSPMQREQFVVSEIGYIHAGDLQGYR